MPRPIVILLTALLCACATGDAGWRQESKATVVLMGEWNTSDNRCSDPAPYSSLDACLGHDLAYSIARYARCNGWEPEFYSEQSRLVADSNLATQMAQDGVPEFWVSIYYTAVRWGGWYGWHFGGCDG